MMKAIIFFAIVCKLYGLIPEQAFAGAEPQIPVSASWGMTMAQVQRLPELERGADGTLLNSYTIRGTSQDEFVARWQGRVISLYVDNAFGLYAMNIEMTPQAVRHTQIAADQELLDLEQCAPIRFAIMRKYGDPLGLAVTWDTSEIQPIPGSYASAATDTETASLQWPYARNWLIWEGQETRLALGEQSVWYASRVGLAKRERAKEELEKERGRSLDRELERRVQRQQQIDEARATVSSRALTFESFF